MQLNLVRYAFLVSFVLHLIEVVTYYVVDYDIVCHNNKILTTSSVELYILIV
jgi:hypothetical protein